MILEEIADIKRRRCRSTAEYLLNKFGMLSGLEFTDDKIGIPVLSAVDLPNFRLTRLHSARRCIQLKRASLYISTNVTRRLRGFFTNRGNIWNF